MMNWIAAINAMGARRPRKQQLFCSRKELPNEVVAVIRLTWYKNSRAYSVEELQIIDLLDETDKAVQMLIQEALKAGADVSVLTAQCPTRFGIE